MNSDTNEVEELNRLSNETTGAVILTYLKMTGLKIALILKFNVLLMRSGIKRIVNQLSDHSLFALFASLR